MRIDAEMSRWSTHLEPGLPTTRRSYPFVPDMIKFYLGQEAILPNVPTYICARENDKKYVLENLDKLVVKSTNESGGYGMLMGHQATKKSEKSSPARSGMTRATTSPNRRRTPASTPAYVEDRFEGRANRPSPLHPLWREGGRHARGLTRVALRKGSLVVKQQPGRWKQDTWVLEEE